MTGAYREHGSRRRARRSSATCRRGWRLGAPGDRAAPARRRSRRLEAGGRPALMIPLPNRDRRPSDAPTPRRWPTAAPAGCLDETECSAGNSGAAPDRDPDRSRRLAARRRERAGALARTDAAERLADVVADSPSTRRGGALMRALPLDIGVDPLRRDRRHRHERHRRDAAQSRLQGAGQRSRRQRQREAAARARHPDRDRPSRRESRPTPRSSSSPRR